VPRSVLRLSTARLRGAAAALALIVPAFAGPFFNGSPLARDLPAVATPFEVGDSRAGNYLAALVAGATRDTFAAATYFRETLRADPTNAELLDRAFLASLANGDMAEAFRYAEALTKRQNNHPLAWLALAGRDFGLKRYGQARAALAKSGPTRARDVTATLLAAWAHAGAKEGKQALAAVEKLTDPAFAVFRDFHAAQILDQTGKRDEALARMKKAYEGEKQTLRLVDAYGRMLSARGKGDEALAIYRDFARALPRHPIVLSAIADLEAGKTLKPLIADAREGAGETLYGLGAAGGRTGDELASLVYLRLGLHLAPDNAMALLSLADVYERTKQYERAIDVYRAVPASSPLRGTAEVQAALNLEQLNRVEDSAKQLAAIVEERPADIDALMALGNLQITRKDFPAAVAALDKAVAQVKPEPGYWSLYYRRGVAHERARQWDKAEADFRQALALYPDQPMVLNYLGYSWVDRGMNLDEAFKMLRRAVELRPTDGYIVDSLGWAYYKLGKYAEATAELERAIELKPADPVINDHLGDAYWRVGRKLEATFQWNKARDLKPEPEDLTKILRKIQDGLEDVPGLPPPPPPIPGLGADMGGMEPPAALPLAPAPLAPAPAPPAPAGSGG
jgi:tetratricopeptide (TPR) repeat protein